MRIQIVVVPTAETTVLVNALLFAKASLAVAKYLVIAPDTLLASVTVMVAASIAFGKQTAIGLVAEISGRIQVGLNKPKSTVKLVFAAPSSDVGSPLSVKRTVSLMTITPIPVPWSWLSTSPEVLGSKVPAPVKSFGPPPVELT